MFNYVHLIQINGDGDRTTVLYCTWYSTFLLYNPACGFYIRVQSKCKITHASLKKAGFFKLREVCNLASLLSEALADARLCLLARKDAHRHAAV